MGKVVWMVSGNKGGVGKSLFCLALASVLEIRKEPFAVLDGDGRTGDVYATFVRKVPARQADFRDLRPEMHNCSQDEVYEAIIHQMMRICNHLIINTPDGADSTLMKWFDMTLAHTERHGFEFKFVYLMSDRADGLDMIPGLMKRFGYFFPVRNLYFGDPNLFLTFNHIYKKAVDMVIDFPVLRGEEARMLFSLKTWPFQAVNLKDKDSGSFTVPILSRSRLLTWISDVAEQISDMIDRDASNVKPTAL
jgi:hypothetical protein